MNAEELQAEAKKIVRADRANFQPLRLEADIIALMTRAVREEREACAKAIEGRIGPSYEFADRQQNGLLREIATAIRSERRE